MSKKSGLGSFICGALIGVGVGILFAPQEGMKTRYELKKKFEDVLEQIKTIDKDDLKKAFDAKVADIKKELEDLDGEKVYKIAVAKSNDIKKKLGDLKNLAVEKGTPVLEDAVDGLRQKTIDVLNSAVKKLETK